jgi:adenosylmethionine---8-amino-7-oxononanoate aminotransferase
VGDVRQLGFMAGIELVKDKEKGIPFPYGERTGFKVAYKCREKGVFLRPLGDVMVLMPPFGGGKGTHRPSVGCLKMGN